MSKTWADTFGGPQSSCVYPIFTSVWDIQRNPRQLEKNYSQSAFMHIAVYMLPVVCFDVEKPTFPASASILLVLVLIPILILIILVILWSFDKMRCNESCKFLVDVGRTRITARQDVHVRRAAVATWCVYIWFLNNNITVHATLATQESAVSSSNTWRITLHQRHPLLHLAPLWWLPWYNLLLVLDVDRATSAHFVGVLPLPQDSPKSKCAKPCRIQIYIYTHYIYTHTYITLTLWVGWLGRVFMWFEKTCWTAGWLMPILAQVIQAATATISSHPSLLSLIPPAGWWGGGLRRASNLTLVRVGFGLCLS